MPYALGIDVGNAKVKLCLADADDLTVRWTSRPLPYDARRARARHADFEAGLPAAIAEVTAGLDVRVAVCVMSSGYAYPSYREGAEHTMDVLQKALPRAAVFALGLDGVPTPAAEVAASAERVAFTNGVGAAHLAARLPVMGEPACGLVIDTGGDTSQVNPLVDGAVDPAALAEPRGPLDHRLRHGKFVWIGAQSTPLEALAARVDLGGRSYPVIPRGVRFDNVSSLLGLLPPEEAAKLSLFGMHPARATALAALAEAVNLDRELATEEELLALARGFFELAVERLAVELVRALETLPPRCRGRAALFGLGVELSRAAALRARVPAEGIVLGADHMSPPLAIVASVYGACHAALELHLGRRLPAALGPRAA
ncbi:MAG TPA: hypothetical protein PLR99_00010 [Polyangiaceae bacterium]|nr:hypothetical protein [Polyangiaceae bacterium]